MQIEPGEIIHANGTDGNLYTVIGYSKSDDTLHLVRLHTLPPVKGLLVPLDDEALVNTADAAKKSIPLCANVWETKSVQATDVTTTGARLTSRAVDRLLRALGRSVARSHYHAVHAPSPFKANRSVVPVSGKCWGPEEMESLCEASLDFWLTSGRFAEAFEQALAQRLGRRYALAVNSGSSANLLAIAALCSPLLKERRLMPGDEVITVAAGFPTTVSPLVQLGLTPVFVDVTPPTYNAVAEQVAAAITERTRAIFMAHTLGNPFDLTTIRTVAQKHDLWLVEDSCDALGSTYTLAGNIGMCGSFGHLATFSFYPAHHITMGEGGAVVCDDPLLRKIVLSLRDWGRDCWCAPGADDTCTRRYTWKFPLLPEGYDHKYVYSHLGYNLKITDMQAAVGVEQLKRLTAFTALRKRNFALLTEALAPLEGGPLTLPRATPHSDPSWFGYLLTIEKNYDRADLLQYLNYRRIGTRLLFAGNITNQPCFEGVSHRVAANLLGTDKIMQRTFWIGLYPALTEDHILYAAHTLREYFKKQRSPRLK
ncbi:MULTISPECIES: lipopolysaccharide biosynthesis protein RfbH [Desulfovibrio]|uniref:CDP-6-deoxy-D-xylo-4-hexulose-3-dehydrase n=2 Tax=Desulfovibrio TaxID=872 RepID=A0AA94HUI0_DESDE|nr:MULTISPECIES: lipopolysaccharide biosynthesis protein RfbH [Desulfovibrio]ATD81552.1 lipopolysaccharide biosynthesis protein RfbH [Desulfovibrio sp. G11]SFW66906.1 CDP-6-deoxy-D-xylo-4-hexulose-3-dehydrase [Desulfovibrio desulfuricans]SPD34266.1 DegT/DnrJ/EryC1/StrS aminotransferase family [Desulfovibrio sp. G11]